MNPQTNTNLVIPCTYILIASSFQHLCSIVGHILTHLVCILLQLRIESKCRQAILVFQILVQRHFVFVIWKYLTETTHADCPATWLGQRIFQSRSDQLFFCRTRPALTACSSLITKATQIILLTVLIQILVTGNIETIRSSS